MKIHDADTCPHCIKRKNLKVNRADQLRVELAIISMRTREWIAIRLIRLADWLMDVDPNDYR